MNNSKVKSLQQAVEDEILKGFIENKCEFSVWTITMAIRAKINNKMIQIEGINFEDVDGLNTQKIEHSFIKHIINKLVKDKLIYNAGYERVWHNNPGYWSYVPTVIHDVKNTKVDDSCNNFWTTKCSKTINSMPSSMNCRVVKKSEEEKLEQKKTIPVSPISNATSSSSSIKSTKNQKVDISSISSKVIRKVTTYFDRRFSKGKPATLHSTLRRMKRDPLTINQIKKIAEESGYNIIQNDRALSHAEVIPTPICITRVLPIVPAMRTSPSPIRRMW